MVHMNMRVSKIRGPTMDPKIVGLLLKGLPKTKKGPLILGNSHMYIQVMRLPCRPQAASPRKQGAEALIPEPRTPAPGSKYPNIKVLGCSGDLVRGLVMGLMALLMAHDGGL